MVRNNDLSFSFLYFDKSGPVVGAFRDWLEVWDVRAGQPCLTPPEWLWAGINQGQTMQWLGRGKSGPRTESRCEPGIPDQPCPSSAAPPQRSHFSVSQLQFPHFVPNGDDSNPCLPGLKWRANIKLLNAILCNWLKFAFKAPDQWSLCLLLLQHVPFIFRAVRYPSSCLYYTPN